MTRGQTGPAISSSAARGASSRSVADEIAVLVLVAVAVLLFLSLVTYNPNDVSWNTAVADHLPANMIGRVGAYLSDLLLQMFGLAAFALPFLLVALAIRALFGRGRGVSARKGIGLVLLLIALAGFLALFPEAKFAVLKNSRNGGAIGYLVEGELARLMNTAGAAILLTVVTVLTLMLAMETSLVALWAGVVRLTQMLGYNPRGDDRPRASEPSAVNPLIKWFGGLKQSFSNRMTRPITIGSSGRPDTSILTRDTESARSATVGRRSAVERVVVATPAAKTPTTVSNLTVEAVEIKTMPLPSDVAPASLGEVPESPVRVTKLEPKRIAVPVIPEVGVRADAPWADEAESESRTGLGSDLASDITMDPEVAEMISTASIVRTVAALPGEEGALTDVRPRVRKIAVKPGYRLPPSELLEVPVGHHEQAEEELRERATLLAEKCKEFSVTGHIHRINPGPVVTTFEFKPDPGVKYSRVVSLADDLCLALKAESIRIDRIPGKSTVGIEVPNATRETIHIREVLESNRFQKTESKLTIALGKTINGEVYVADLAKMPHLLIAGATGAGKSVTLNAIICSILYKASPEEVKFIMVDPKRLELGLYEGIPHLLTPIVTEPKRAANALKWATNEMEGRYRELAKYGVRNIDQYNRYVRETTHPTLSADDPEAPKPLPYIVITIDELADLMMVARGDVETSIARLAQMARAVGIHLVVATQRPSVDVITGVIKANFPSRIAFRVSSKVDSRTIIDANGAEGLLGQGDMLFLPPASSRLVRVHGSFVNEDEVKKITDHTRNQARPDYNESVTMSEQEASGGDELAGERDELFDEALAIITDMGRASTSVLQRRLSIGYGRAAKILDLMEMGGFIGPVDGAKPRKVLQAAYEFRERVAQRIEERLE